MKFYKVKECQAALAVARARNGTGASEEATKRAALIGEGKRVSPLERVIIRQSVHGFVDRAKAVQGILKLRLKTRSSQKRAGLGYRTSVSIKKVVGSRTKRPRRRKTTVS